MDRNYSELKIGIIGGGQLGKMMIQEAKKMGFYITVLDPTLSCPAHSICDEHIIADFDNESSIRLLADKSDIITYEFEHINCDILLKLENEGIKIFPSAKSLKIIQNKLTQKQKLAENNIPVADFIEINFIDDMYTAGKKYDYPFILKTCTGGYDGKGNAFVEDEIKVKEAFEALGEGKIPLMAEKLVPFTLEISVLACRGYNGDIVVYPVAENRHIENILHETIVPANILKETSEKAMMLANKVMEVFEGIGMFCVEMFVTEDGNVLINEVAPRPHNSGHYSIEGCITSQFENHIRAITGLPLGNTSLINPTVMLNILGDKNYNGKVVVSGLYEALKVKNVKVHIYGKEFTQPKRKMGHLTVTAPTVEEAQKSAYSAFKKIKIISKN